MDYVFIGLNTSVCSIASLESLLISNNNFDCYPPCLDKKQLTNDYTYDMIPCSYSYTQDDAICSLISATNLRSIAANKGLAGWECNANVPVTNPCLNTTDWFGLHCTSGGIIDSLILSFSSISGMLS